MEELMQKRIEQFNQFVMSQDIDKLPVGLFSGKMGLCIYFYHQSKFLRNKKLEKFADRLLESLIKQLSTKSYINIEDGIAGICLVLNYLINKGIQTGNANYILSELDDRIYQKAWFELLKNNSGSIEALQSILQVALYFSIRLKNKDLSKDNRFTFESIVIKVINQIENAPNPSVIFSEPSMFSINQYFICNYLYLLSNVYALGFFNYKITKILDEIYPKLASTYPFLQTNRLQLLSVVEYLNTKIERDLYAQYAIRLRQDINMDYIINNEFKHRNLLLRDGLCGMYLFQNVLLKNTQLPESLISHRIIYSDLWDNTYKEQKISDSSIGLFTGISGIILIYMNLKGEIEL